MFKRTNNIIYFSYTSVKDNKIVLLEHGFISKLRIFAAEK